MVFSVNVFNFNPYGNLNGVESVADFTMFASIVENEEIKKINLKVNSYLESLKVF